MTKQSPTTEPVPNTAVPSDDSEPERWLENLADKTVETWYRDQNQIARSILDALPARPAIRAALEAIQRDAVHVRNIQAGGTRIFYLRRNPDRPAAVLAMRRSIDGDEEILLDPAHITGTAAQAIDWFVPSPDGQQVAVALSDTGAEQGIVRFLDVATRALRDDVLAGLPYSVLVAWLDDRTLLYAPMRPQGVTADGVPVPGRVYVHRVGESPASDIGLFDPTRNVDIPSVPGGVPTPVVSGRWALIVSRYGADADIAIYAALRDDLDDPARLQWRQVVALDEQVTSFAVAGDTLFMVSEHAAPRGQLRARSLVRSHDDGDSTILPERESVLRAVFAANDRLILLGRAGAHDMLETLNLADRSIQEVGLPVVGTVDNIVVIEDSAAAMLELESWFSPAQVHVWDLNDHTISLLSAAEQAQPTNSPYVVDEMSATSADGTRIPLSVLRRSDTPRDGTAPTILFAYGSYGISAGPIYWPHILAWLSLGGVYAFAHVRGGGEFGRAWHEAGKGMNKRKVIDDFLACAEWLVSEGYTRPERLAAEAGSAGGLVIGGAMLRRPDLFRAVVLRSALLNALRFETHPDSPLHVPEFGTSATAEGLANLESLDVVRNVVPGTAYPAVLLTAGYRDPRTPAWHAGKLAARLTEASSSNRPVLLRVEFEGGHLWGQQADPLAEHTDVYSFVLHELGGFGNVAAAPGHAGEQNIE